MISVVLLQIKNEFELPRLFVKINFSLNTVRFTLIIDIISILNIYINNFLL